MQDRVQSCPCRIQLCGSRGVIHSEPLFPQLYVGLKRAAREELTQRGMAWIQAWGWVLGNSIITASRICIWTPLLPVLHPHDPLRTEKQGPGELKGPLGVAPGGTERLCS